MSREISTKASARLIGPIDYCLAANSTWIVAKILAFIASESTVARTRGAKKSGQDPGQILPPLGGGLVNEQSIYNHILDFTTKLTPKDSEDFDGLAQIALTPLKTAQLMSWLAGA